MIRLNAHSMKYTGSYARYAAHVLHLGTSSVCPVKQAIRAVRARAMRPYGLKLHKIPSYSPRRLYSCGPSPQSMLSTHLSLNWANTDIQSLVMQMSVLAASANSTESAGDASPATKQDISELTFTPRSTSPPICAAPSTKGSTATNAFKTQSWI